MTTKEFTGRLKIFGYHCQEIMRMKPDISQPMGLSFWTDTPDKNLNIKVRCSPPNALKGHEWDQVWFDGDLIGNRSGAVQKLAELYTPGFAEGITE